MNYRWLFFNFTDRLPWLQWFAAVACIYVATSIFYYFGVGTGAEAGRSLPAFSIIGAAILAVQAALSLSLNVKRFNDLNFPYWVGFAFTALEAVPGLIGLFGWSASFASSFAEVDFALGLLLYCVSVAGYAWLGFHRGTIGDNFYGADPLAGAPEAEKLPGASGAPPQFNGIKLLFLPHGRIGRLPFIVCTLIAVACLVFGYQSLMWAISFLPLSTFPIAISLVFFLFVYPIFWILGCFAAKRMHDVDRWGGWPVLFGWHIFLCSGHLLGRKFKFNAGSVWEYMVLAYIAVLLAWLLAELFLRAGTEGENSFGPAPGNAGQEPG